MDTREVQQALWNLGWPISVDGDFGPQTFEAVSDFQRGFAFWDLLVDGHAGPQTWNALQHSVADNGSCGRYFRFSEFKSKGNGWIKVERTLVRALDIYRERYGPTPVVSGYRDPNYNRKVDGAPNSQHLYGNAADIPGVAAVGAIRNLRLFSGIGFRQRDGIVVHVDVRHVGPNTTCGTPDNPTVWEYVR
jgi:Putative peptidoglycan binding domain/Peptidase M15